SPALLICLHHRDLFIHHFLGLYGIARPIGVRGLPHFLPCIHRRHLSLQLGILLLSHLSNYLARDVADMDVDARVDAGIGMEVDVGVDVEDEVEGDVESTDRGTMKVGVDVNDGIDIPDGMLMLDAMERLEQVEEVVQDN
nr:hypothetical protein [Tanacetum cinerariifolium]